MKELASPCCGSCEHQRRQIFRDCRHWDCIRFADNGHIDNYSPRNPIPLIQVSGVREMVKEAWQDGYQAHIDYPDMPSLVGEYMKALEDKR